MIHGIGIDLVQLDRFARFARDHRDRLPHMFSPWERAQPARLPEAFAVKEATLKALGGLSGWELDWREIALAADGRLRLHGSTRAHAARLGVKGITGSVARRADACVIATAIATR